MHGGCVSVSVRARCVHTLHWHRRATLTSWVIGHSFAVVYTDPVIPLPSWMNVCMRKNHHKNFHILLRARLKKSSKFYHTAIFMSFLDSVNIVTTVFYYMIYRGILFYWLLLLLSSSFLAILRALIHHNHFFVFVCFFFNILPAFSFTFLHWQQYVHSREREKSISCNPKRFTNEEKWPEPAAGAR